MTDRIVNIDVLKRACTVTLRLGAFSFATDRSRRRLRRESLLRPFLRTLFTYGEQVMFIDTSYFTVPNLLLSQFLHISADF
jgi:hypothetical protein